jgi:hypothetical protein
MINNRRGVSAVVANVLIILLVVVGVALIWAAVRPSIEKGAQGVQADCFTIQLEPTTCTPLSGSAATCAGTSSASAAQATACANVANPISTTCTTGNECVFTAATAGSATDLAVTIKRNPGDGTLTGLKLIYEEDDGTSVATVDAVDTQGAAGTGFTQPELLGSQKYFPKADVALTTALASGKTWADVDQVTIAMQVGSGKNLCNVVHQPIPCS